MILITGATGTVGRPLTGLLHARGVPVRAVTRSPGAAGLPTGVETIAAVLDRPARSYAAWVEDHAADFKE